MAPKSRKGK